MSNFRRLIESVIFEAASDKVKERLIKKYMTGDPNIDAHRDYYANSIDLIHDHHLPDSNKSQADLEWMADRHFSGDSSFSIHGHVSNKHLLTEFNKPAIKDKMPKKKLNQYKSWGEFEEAITPHLGTAMTAKEKADADTKVIFKNDTHIVRQHLSQDSMVQAAKLQKDNPHYEKCGGKATWCVSVEEDSGKQYYDHYTKMGKHPFYTIEHTANHPTDPNRKFAVLADPTRDEMTHEVRDELQVSKMDLGNYAIKNQSILHTQPGQYISKMLGLSHTPKGISYKEIGRDVNIEKKEGGGYIKTKIGSSDKTIEHLNDNFDLHGPYESDSLSYRKNGNYKDGKKHGEFTYFEKGSGITIERENWNEGKLSEEKQFNSINGNLGSHIKYDENENPIEKTTFYKDGNLRSHHFYGENWNEGKSFDEKGNIKISSSYKIRNGSSYKTKTLYREDGTKINEENVKDGQLHGKQIEYHPNGNKSIEENYMNGELHGMARTYHENGNEKSSTPYRYGKADGVARERREDGSLISETEYSKGYKNGIKKTYHENGNVESEIPHVKGEAHGIVRGYHENGNIKTEYEAYRGYVKGKYKVFREDGYLRYIKNHKTGGNIEYKEFEDHEKVKDYDFENKKPIYESHNRFRKIIEGK